VHGGTEVGEDRYVTARARLDPSLAPAHADAAARAAWASHGWAHPAAVAYLEHESGRSGTAEQRQRPAPARQRMLPVWPSE